MAIFKGLQLRPEQFQAILVERIGFHSVSVAADPGGTGGFERPLLIARKAPAGEAEAAGAGAAAAGAVAAAHLIGGSARQPF